jgi:hypothetical protein
MNVSFEHHLLLQLSEQCEDLLTNNALQLVGPSSIMAKQTDGTFSIDLSAHIHIRHQQSSTPTGMSSQRRAYVVLLGGARFAIGIPTMRFLSLEQFSEGAFPMVHLQSNALARISIRDENHFDMKTVELLTSS